MKKGIGIDFDLPESYDFLRREAEQTLHTILQDYPRAKQIYEKLTADPELNGCWDVSNFFVVKKLLYNDHGEIHAKIVASNAAKMLSILLEHGLNTDIVEHGNGKYDVDDSFVVVIAGGLLHDIGIQVDKDNHNTYSTYLALDILKRNLYPIYEDLEKFAEVRGFILNAIYEHPPNVKDLSVEAALVGIADATDMTKGRGRLAFDLGEATIHTVSALAIEKVSVKKGTEKPVIIEVEMSNSSGIFQIEQNLFLKYKGGPLEDMIEIIAKAVPEEGTKDKRIIYKVSVKDGKLVAVGSGETEEYIDY